MIIEDGYDGLVEVDGGPRSRTPGPPSVVIQYVAKCLPSSASCNGAAGHVVFSLGQKLFPLLRCIRARALRVALGLHDLILFDGCIIWMYEDVQGKIPAWLMPPAGERSRGQPGVIRVHGEETVSNRSAWLRWRPGWMAPGRILVTETHVLPPGSALMHPRRGPRIGDVVADVLKAFGFWKLS